jgi:uncharacterized membrane protein
MSLLRFEVRGRGAGLWTGAFSLGQWLSPIIVTFFSLRVGGLLPSLGVISLAAFVAMALALVACLRKSPPASAAVPG